ncbi:SGNH/GDSL hydrolase family protein [Gordonia hankookensis]
MWVASILLAVGVSGCSEPEIVSLGPTVVVIGDSTTSGTRYGGLGRSNWVRIAERRAQDDRLGVRFVVSAKGGAGYLLPGTQGTTFVSQAERTVTEDTALVVFFGSANDTDAPGDYAASVTRAYTIVRDRSPRARILVIGPAWSRFEPPTGQLLARVGTLKDVARHDGAEFADPIAEDWLGDRQGMVGGDGVHPTDRAHLVFADRIYPLVRSLLATGRPG